MEITLAFQTEIFIRAIILGVILGIVYDVFRALRRIFKTKALGTAIYDSAFCLVCLPIFLMFMLRFSGGELRFYIPAGAGLGAALYFIALSPIVLAVFLALVHGALVINRKTSVLLYKVFKMPRGN